VTSTVSPAPTRRPRRNRRRSTSTNRPARTSASATPAVRTSATRPVHAAAIAPDAAGFAEFALPASLVAALNASGIHRPTPIQTQALPDALAGRDVLGRAQTGSGKTLAFGLPMITRLGATLAARRPRGCRGLILLPTRELAQQVDDVLRPLAQLLSLRTLVIVGGMPINRQIAELRRGVDIVVATPGRLVDLMARRDVVLDGVSVTVLDEADHMADLGFLPAVTRILDAIPRGGQTMLFSATLDRGVDRLVTRYLARPASHTVDQAGVTIPTMEHRVFRLTRDDKVAVAAEIAARPERTLFFVRTKHGADRLARQMRTRGVNAAAIHGNLNQNQRRRALDGFSSGGIRVLVATDIAARGIHVDDLDLVVHYDPPADHKTYAHRSGRTARSGAVGTVVSLVEPHQVSDVNGIHAAASVRAQSSKVYPGHIALREIVSPGERG